MNTRKRAKNDTKTLRNSDDFARESVRLAHKKLNALEAEITRLRRLVPARPVMHGRCSLCGEPCRPTGRFCHAHAWAEGEA